eukprot:2242626-Lingulodinium_polyedra.AAC.1
MEEPPARARQLGRPDCLQAWATGAGSQSSILNSPHPPPKGPSLPLKRGSSANMSRYHRSLALTSRAAASSS